MIATMIATLLTAGAPMPVSPPPPLTTQALFDAATAAVDADRCAEGVAGLEAIELRPSAIRNLKVAAVIKLRKGRCLVRLNRLSEASAALHDGMAVLRIDDPVYGSDVVQAHDALGRIAFYNYDYAAARGEFETVRAALPDADRLDPLLWLARVTMFDDSGDALAFTQQALALLPPAKTGEERKGAAAVHTLHARALLNHGAAPAAYKELTQALADQGGLSMRVGYSDIVTRSDLAIAALLSNRPDDARQYLAYTGAGHSEKAPFGAAAATGLPACGGADDGLPDDIAIVEFGVRDDGSTTHVIPVYASRPGKWVLNYARAVADWSWRQADVANLSPFFRALTRVELRCTTSFARPSVADLLKVDLATWLTANKVDPFRPSGSDAAWLPGARTELARRQAAGETVTLLPVLIAIAYNAVTPDTETTAMLTEASRIAATAQAPATAQLSIDLALSRVGPETAKYRGFLRAALARPAVAADPRAAAAVRLLLAEPRYREAAPANAAALLTDVATDMRLPANDTLKVSALVRRASLEARQGDMAAARASYDKTGLDAQQCALVDARPVLRSAGGAGAYPDEAMRWGFDGWTKVEYDIVASGKTAALRTVIAYPPFVFRDAAIGVVKQSRYTMTYRPDGTAGCGGAQQTVNFHIN